ncbi:hypothetical protein K4H28_00025 [Deefgea tanakiae]|uniref:Uncharacterized protein n=1 Tax=Deefgea tanakiae TaxID=2865840 RepID=A0ABX8ZAH3_9NEIS|nr:hypothetical protein [Deefgea tanakiae]QZA77869.1 hypothetical protein K4H28_00025 [Deefgea tanakiae]
MIDEIQLEQAFIVNVDSLEESRADDYALNHLRKFEKRFYFEKSTDWRNEDEFRFVVFDCADELYFEYKHSLSGIMFGADCTDEDISKVCSLTKHLGLQYQQLKWRNCTPWFDFGRTKWL